MMRTIDRRRIRIAVMAAVLTLSAGFLQAQKNQAPKSAVPSRPDARTIAHVLDRLGFGARPGDVERVQKMGLAKYIEQQLTP